MKTNSTKITARERKEHKRETVSLRSLCSFVAIVISLLLAGTVAQAQVNSGSNGSDGAFNPTTNIVINMADHPNGIYHYTSVNISNGVTVTFIPNANNTPVYWLVQSNVVINGMVDLSGQTANGVIGGVGGPGGWSGGGGGTSPSSGQGPGGGAVYYLNGGYNYGGGGGFGTGGISPATGNPVANTYGNSFLLPMLGGSGGGGALPSMNSGGGGGGGAILVVASGTVQLNGTILAEGGYSGGFSGCGSGGGIRLVTAKMIGSGEILARKGCSGVYIPGGLGRVRIDALEYSFGGTIEGVFTRGSQFIIFPTPGQGTQLTITSIGGVPVSASPTGALSTPDAVLSAQQNNPIPIVVRCSNLPLNTQITVSVKPANGAAVSATSLNNTGTLSSSTATVLINMPRGGGLIYATAATGH